MELVLENVFIPQDYKLILDQVQRYIHKFDRNAKVVIAGGCLRDLFLGGEPKDIDVFVMSSKFSVPQNRTTIKKEFIQSCWPSFAEVDDYVHHNSSGHNSAGYVFDFVCSFKNRLVVNIIFYHNKLKAEHLLSCFDLSTSQVLMNGAPHFDISFTDIFAKSITDKIIRIDEKHTKTERRIENLIAKYPFLKREIVEDEIPF